MIASELLGAVLAGGESRRFGRDKASEVIGGRSLVTRAAETLEEVFGQIVIVSSREPTTGRWPHIPDVRNGQGPLAGVEAALLCAKRLGLEGAFVLACDLPLVDDATVRTIVEASEGAAACAPVRGGHPGLEPLCAVYRASCLPVVSEALDREKRSVHEAFFSAGGSTTAVPGDVFLNVNSAEEVKAAEVALAGQAVPPMRTSGS